MERTKLLDFSNWIFYRRGSNQNIEEFSKKFNLNYLHFLNNNLKWAWIIEVFVTGILHSFENGNSNGRMCCRSIGIGIGNGNVIRI